MKTFKILSLGLLFALLFGVYNFANINQVKAVTDSTTASAEFVADDITAESLGVAEKDTTFWGKFKLNTRSVFTFDKAKQAHIDLKKANIKLLAAKKLADESTDSKAQDRLQKALEKYKNKMAAVEKRAKKLPEAKKEAVLQRLDEHQLKQHQILRHLQEKMPDQVKDKITALREERMKSWYEHQKETFQKRLEKAVEVGDDGSKFNNLQVMATLTEMGEVLPIEAKDKIEAIMDKTQAQLNAKLHNLNEEEKDKLKQYLEKVELEKVHKFHLLDRLDNGEAPISAQESIRRIKNTNLNAIEHDFSELDKTGKDRFLKKHFETNGNVGKIKILNRLQNNTSGEYKVKIRRLDEQQQEKLKNRIQNTSNQAALDRLEKRVKDLPSAALKKEVRDHKANIRNREQQPSTSNHQ